MTPTPNKKARLLIPAERTQQYRSLPGQAVTAAFLGMHGAVVMADAASSLESFLPLYEVVSVEILPHSETQALALIEYRRRIVTCEACQRPYYGMPELLAYSVGPRREHCWCSPACQQILIAQDQAQVEQRRQEIGDLVEAGMQYLRLRQAVPADVRGYMTAGEWDEVRQQCSQEYTTLRRDLASVLASRCKALGGNTKQAVPTRAPIFAAVEAVPMSLFVEVAS